MKIGTIAENPMQWLTLALGFIPKPIPETQASLILARTLQVATQFGVFEALESSLTAEEVAAQCQVHPEALQKLLNILVTSGYLRRNGKQYRLTLTSRKWLLKNSPCSLYDYVISRSLTWEWLKHLEDYMQTGNPLQIHQEMTPQQWEQYQRGMRSLAGITAATVARRTPVPKGARTMLDVGGAHGYYSVMLCRRYPNLQATILELPEAVEYAAPLLAKEQMGDQVRYKAGDILTEDLGSETYDLIFISNLVHHFDAETNCQLFCRLARALRPGGNLVVQGAIFSQDNHQMFYDTEQLGNLWDLFFSLTSGAGSWAYEDIAAWQREAGLMPWKPLRMMTGAGQQVASKPARYKVS